MSVFYFRWSPPTFYLAFIRTCYRLFFLSFTRYPLWHSLSHMFRHLSVCHISWHPMPHVFWNIIGHAFWHSKRILWHLISYSVWHICWFYAYVVFFGDVLWDSILTFFLAFYLAFLLTFIIYFTCSSGFIRQRARHLLWIIFWQSIPHPINHVFWLILTSYLAFCLASSLSFSHILLTYILLGILCHLFGSGKTQTASGLWRAGVNLMMFGSGKAQSVWAGYRFGSGKAQNSAMWQWWYWGGEEEEEQKEQTHLKI